MIQLEHDYEVIGFDSLIIQMCEKILRLLWAATQSAISDNAMEGLRNREVHNIVKKEKNSMTRNFFAISNPFSFLKSNGLCYFIAVSSMWLIIN